MQSEQEEHDDAPIEDRAKQLTTSKPPTLIPPQVRPIADVLSSNNQPIKADFEHDMRMDPKFERILDALTTPFRLCDAMRQGDLR